MATEVKRPTAMMLMVLREMLAGLGTHHDVRGRSAHGGRSAILTGLMKRKLIDRDSKITKLGKEQVR